MPDPRFIVERHTDDRAYAYRVRDTGHDDVTHGHGMRLDDALMLADAHENLVPRPQPRGLEPDAGEATIHGPRL